MMNEMNEKLNKKTQDLGLQKENRRNIKDNTINYLINVSRQLRIQCLKLAY